MVPKIDKFGTELNEIMQKEQSDFPSCIKVGNGD